VATNTLGFSETQRMELRTLIRLASEIIANYWPMRTFVHHNPLHGLEDIPFDQAISRAQQLLGGRGYLNSDTFRDYYRFGRILDRHLDVALKTRSPDAAVELGNRRVTQREVLRALMVQELFVP